MADTGKSKFSLNTEVNFFGECNGKKAPKWLFFTPNDASKIRPMQVKRDMLLDGRKWKMKTLEQGVYAVSRYELAIFATKVNTIEKQLVSDCNDHLNKKNGKKDAKFKKADDVAALKDAKKDKDLQKLFKAAGGAVFSLYQKTEKKVSDKVSLALDEVEADKGDNKKGLKDGKAAMRKYMATNFKSLFQGPITTAGTALINLSGDLKQDKLPAKKALNAALKKLKEAEADFEKQSGKAKEACNAALDLGESMAGNKDSDPALRELGATIDDGTDAAKALEKTIENIEATSDMLDKYCILVSRALDNDDDDQAMKSLALRTAKAGSELKAKIPAYVKTSGAATTRLKKFDAAFKKLEKELKK